MQINPYCGLFPFEYKKQNEPGERNSLEYEDKEFFHGRTTAIQSYLKHLKEKKFLVITGASGIGKSSLVNAGLLPELEELGFLVLDIIDLGKEYNNILERLENVAQKASTGKGVLVIHQVEEILPNKKKRSVFFKKIKDLLATKNKGFKIILTVHSSSEDILRRLSKDDLWNNACWELMPCTSEELQEIAFTPAKQRALVFESPAFRNKIIEDVKNGPGALPILSWVMSELFQSYIDKDSKSGERILKEECYISLNGVSGIINKKLDEIYESFSEEEQISMQKVMLRMTNCRERSLLPRRVKQKNFIYTHSKENESVEKILKVLISARLLVQSWDYEKKEVYIEPAHESVISGWKRLQTWVNTIGISEMINLDRLYEDTQKYINCKDKRDRHRKAYLWHDDIRLNKMSWERKQAIFLQPDSVDNKKSESNVRRWLRKSLTSRVKETHPFTLLNQQEDDFIKASDRKKMRSIMLRYLLSLGFIIGITISIGYWNKDRIKLAISQKINKELTDDLKDRKKELTTASIELEKKKKHIETLFSAFNFHPNGFALTHQKDKGFYFINKLGEEVFGLYNWKWARPFNATTGFARVAKQVGGTTYLLSREGCKYELANHLDSLSESTTALDLSGYNLDTIPEKVMQCSQLEILILNNNNIRKIPATIVNLSHLKELHLKCNQFIDLKAKEKVLDFLNRPELRFYQ